ncbi:hypothetical protein [uncultured Bosea sp.]|uniref:hypothetical protein n=1 Tax=uncultured Bosea sp. TaxID=211457 RepID=UPI0025EB7D68|nr:hypothetical protein [uncultured Bosea sp.]
MISIEMITIVACTYAAFLAYSAAAYGVVFFRSDYVLASIGVGALYVVLCVAGNQYDLLGPEWNEHRRSRGGGRELVDPDDIAEKARTRYILDGGLMAFVIALFHALLRNPGGLAVRDKAFLDSHGRWRELPRAAAELVAPRVMDRIGRARAAAAVPASWCREAELWLEPIRAANGTEWHRAETRNRALEQET